MLVPCLAEHSEEVAAKEDGCAGFSFDLLPIGNQERRGSEDVGEGSARTHTLCSNSPQKCWRFRGVSERTMNTSMRDVTGW